MREIVSDCIPSVNDSDETDIYIYRIRIAVNGIITVNILLVLTDLLYTNIDDNNKKIILELFFFIYQ